MNVGKQVKYGLEKVWKSKLSNTAKNLYMELFLECNSNYWEDVELSTKQLADRLKVSEVQIRRARKELKENEYIEYEKGVNKNVNSIYKIIEKDKNVRLDVRVDEPLEVREDVLVDNSSIEEVQTYETQEKLEKQKNNKEVENVRVNVCDNVRESV